MYISMKKILIVCLIMLCSATSLYAQQFFTVDPLRVFTVEELDGYGFLSKFISNDTLRVENYPFISGRDNECYRIMHYSIELPLYLTRVVAVDIHTSHYIFFVDSTKYVTIKSIDEKKDTILPRDTTFLLDLYQFHRDPYYRIKNAPYRYFRDIYVARKDCALLTFCNIPLDDIKKILESLKIYRCVEFFWCDSEREE